MAAQTIALTLTGQTLVANALANGTTIEITHVAFGDGGGNPVSVDRTRVALVNEVYETTIGSVVTDPSDATLRGLQYEIPPEEGGYVIREVGLKDASGTLIAHGPIPEVEKPATESSFALSIAGTIWIKVTGADAIDIAVSVSGAVPQVRRLTAGLGISGGGDLSADRRVDLDLVELAIATSIPSDASFPAYRPSGDDAAGKHPRIPIELLDRRWRQRDIDLLWFGQF